MKLTAILATDCAGAIGQGTGLPWPRMSRDLRRFRDATMGKACLVGRKTYETLPPLNGRHLLVVTRGTLQARRASWRGAIAGFVPDLDRFDPSVPLPFPVENPSEIVVIGGAEVYRALLPLCDRLLLTLVHGEWPADTWIERPTEGFVQIASETHDPDEASPARLTFSEWVRP